MRLLPRLFLTWVVFLAYISGGLIAPVAHRHNGGNCCQHTHLTVDSHNHTHLEEKCPFGHASCGKSSKQDSSKKPIPASPVDDCPVCELLFMASTAVELVTLQTCETMVAHISTATTATAFFGDLVLPTLRGPPTC